MTVGLHHKYVSAPDPHPSLSEHAATGDCIACAHFYDSQGVIFSNPFAERVSWWGRPKPTPASQTSWKGEPSITVLGPPRGLRSASRYRLTTPVSDICHSQRWVLVSRNQSHPGVNSPFCLYSACLKSLCCGLFRFLEKSA